MQVATIPPIGQPIVCYLVQTGDGKNILIDSEISPNTQLPPGMPQPEMGPSVVEQLATIGVQPSDIDVFVCTHFDPDHVGYNDSFGGAEHIVQRSLYEAAPTTLRSNVAREHWDQPFIHYRFVDGDTELLPGLELIETSGHIRGHQSVLVKLPETGAVILAIDAIVNQSKYNRDPEPGPRDEDVDMMRTSTRKLLDLVEREAVKLVVFGHDAAQWATLKKLPEYYG